MGKSKKSKAQKTRSNASSSGPLLDKLWPRGLKGSLFWKSSEKLPAKSDDQISTGTQSSQGSAVNLAGAASSGSSHNMLPPIIAGAQNLNCASAKSVASSGYGSMPNSTRNSVIESTLPPVPGHSNMYGSDSDIQKSSPDTSPLIAKKWSGSSCRRSRDESTSRVLRSQTFRHKISSSSTCSVPPRPSQSSMYSFVPMTITQLHKQSRGLDFPSPTYAASSRKPHVVKVHDREYSFSSASGRTSIEVREPGMRYRKSSDLYSKRPSLTNRASIASLPPLDEGHKETNTRPQRNSFNCKAYPEKENNLAATASRLSITSQNLNGRPSITSYTSDTGQRRSVHKISITSVDDGKVATNNGPPVAIIEEPVERPTSKRRYGTIMLESPRLCDIQNADSPTEKPLKAAGASKRKDSLVVPGVPQIIFISPTPDPSHGAPSPSSSSSSDQQ